MRKRMPTRRVKPSEQGYALLAAVFFLALLVIALAVAAPQMAKSIQRDRDLETFHRGMQYRRAVQLYYRKFHSYPPNVDALVNTNEIRFLRKQYIDPITGKVDWKPVLWGQNKTPTAMGFFGQPLAGGAATLAGVGPSGGNGMGGPQTPGAGTNSPIGGGSFGGSSVGGGSIFGSSDSGNGTTSSTGSSGSGSGSTDNGSGGSGTTGDQGGTTSGTGSSGTPGSGTGSGLTGQTFGGAGIIGFSPASPKQSILVYKKKDHYNQWEFTYDPISDMQTISGGNAGTVGQPSSGMPSSTGGLGISPGSNSSLPQSGATPQQQQ